MVVFHLPEDTSKVSSMFTVDIFRHAPSLAILVYRGEKCIGHGSIDYKSGQFSIIPKPELRGF